MRHQRDAAERFHPFLEKALRDFRLRGEIDEMLLVNTAGAPVDGDRRRTAEGIPGIPPLPSSIACLRPLARSARGSGTGACPSRRARGRSRRAESLMARQCDADRREHLVHVQVRDDGVVDLELHPQPVALARELESAARRALSSCSTLSTATATCFAMCCMNSRSPSSYPGVGRHAAEAQRAQPAQRGRERHGAVRADVVLEQPRRQVPLGKRRLLRQVRDPDQRLLRPPDEAARRFVDRQLQALP